MWSTYFQALVALYLLIVPDQIHAQEKTSVSFVIEPFEYQHFEYLWNISSDLNYTHTSDALFGNYSLELSVPQGITDATYQGILGRGVHRCHNTQYISFWYKAMGDIIETPNITFSLYSDFECSAASSFPEHECITEDSLIEYIIFDFQLDLIPNPDWNELRVYDNENFDLRRIKGYKIEIQKDEASTFSILFDQLACHGNGTMFELLYLDEGYDQDILLNEGSFEISHYRSAISEKETTIEFGQDGVTYIDYLVEQTEAWGGFVLLGAGVGGAAYFNMSEATELVLDYNVMLAASVPSAVTLRIILEDVSNCFEQCENEQTDLDTKERWYSFHSILDQEGSDQLVIPLMGDTEPGSSFWLTGWAGGIGNSQFDLAYIKSIIFELSVGATLGIGGTVNGTFELSNIHVSTSSIDPDTDVEGENDRCIIEEFFHIRENYEGYTKHEYQAHECCEICNQDPECLYATTSFLGHCYTASYVTTDSVVLTETVAKRHKVETMWMDDSTKRGDFCERCDCREEDLTIDCRNKGLRILPKSFSASWNPKVLDLRDNEHLAFLGVDALDPSVATSIQEIYIGAGTSHIERSIFDSMEALHTFHSEVENFNNFISEPNGQFGDICCSRGESIQIGPTTLTFCEMQLDAPGIDAIYNDFQQYLSATSVEVITEDSEFMREAAESPEKCAAYCQINQDCLYFNYDGRVKNAQHVCYLLADQGAQTETVCCNADDYADFPRTIPGWVSGWPPKTRHDKDNAKVMFSDKNLEADSSNNFEVDYEVSLGADPLRGAVWIEPTVIGAALEDGVGLTITPSRVVLYDSSQFVTVKVTLKDWSQDGTILIRNTITSCDEAFTLTEGSDSIVVISVTPLSSNEQQTIAVVVSGISLFLLVGILVVWKSMPRKNQLLWEVKSDELTFSDPAQVIGRGTFGLVLLAEYRGTAVAIKRVIPPRAIDSIGNKSSIYEEIDTGSQSSELLVAVDMTGDATARDPVASWGNFGMHSQIAPSKPIPSLQSNTPPSNKNTANTTSSWKSLRQEFIDEMCCLSKLRHPCITTVMGAVVEHNAEPMLVMEYMEHGSLYDLLHNETMQMEGELLLHILRDICQGMRFLHSAKPEVIHGDLKAQNILVDSKFRAKVADFGFSHKASLKSTGTPYWMAPELLRGESCNNTATDVYSFGIMLYEVFSRQEPYHGEDPNEVLRLVMDRSVQKRPPLPKHSPPQVQGLMAECLRDDPVRRPSFEELDIRLKREDGDSVQPSLPFHRTKSSKPISLHDIFPKHVADALLEGRTVEPEHRECVTIFFSDIVQFTEISARLEPRKVANLLDRLYTKFDELSQKHDVFKVETIGDAYMAVTNLVKDQPNDHARRIAAFAVDAVAAANGTMIDLDDADQGVVHIRAGFHCGPVVADVVGTRNPRYCLFGDSVNIASRMESNSKSDRIHCSDTAAEILMTQDPSFPLKSRGKIPIKGKGAVHTYWVNQGPTPL